MRRCRWCGVFVKATAQPTVKALPKIDLTARVPWWEVWPARLSVQLLCPSCSEAWGYGVDRDAVDPRGLPVVHR